MNEVLFIVPEGYDNAGAVVPVPEADAPHFDENGWQRAEGAATKEKTKKPK